MCVEIHIIKKRMSSVSKIFLDSVVVEMKTKPSLLFQQILKIVAKDSPKYLVNFNKKALLARLVDTELGTAESPVLSCRWKS